MNVKPILFNTDMVRAILDGRKTVTRRILNPQPILEKPFWKLGGAVWGDNIKSFHPVPCHSLYNRMPYQPGDILHVRETWMNPCEECTCTDCNGCIYGSGYRYKADYRGMENLEKWRPSIHMPKEAARIWLKVTDVRVERLQEMTQVEFMREGVNTCEKCTCKDLCLGLSNARVCYLKSDFIKIWDSTIKKSDLDQYGWETNPWVWVIEFEQCEKPESEV
jgi:hypothetical protein